MFGDKKEKLMKRIIGDGITSMIKDFLVDNPKKVYDAITGMNDHYNRFFDLMAERHGIPSSRIIVCLMKADDTPDSDTRFFVATMKPDGTLDVLEYFSINQLAFIVLNMLKDSDKQKRIIDSIMFMFNNDDKESVEYNQAKGQLVETLVSAIPLPPKQ